MKVTVHAEGTAKDIHQQLVSHAQVYAAAVAAEKTGATPAPAATKPPKAAKPPKAPVEPEETFDDPVPLDEEAEEVEEGEPEETEDETETEDEPETTVDQVRKAFSAYVKKLSAKPGVTPEAAREKAKLLLKKNFKVERVDALKPTQLSAALALVS